VLRASKYVESLARAWPSSLSCKSSIAQKTAFGMDQPEKEGVSAAHDTNPAEPASAATASPARKTASVNALFGRLGSIAAQGAKLVGAQRCVCAVLNSRSASRRAVQQAGRCEGARGHEARRCIQVCCAVLHAVVRLSVFAVCSQSRTSWICPTSA
jgi:hypothetical protein